MTQQSIDDHLLDAGRRTLASHGYRGATAERIAREAGVSRVTLHRRGVTRDAILAELTERAIEDYRRSLWPALTGRGSGRDRLEQALTALCDTAERNLEILVALQAQTDVIFHEQGEEEAMTRTVFTEPLERLLRDGVADGSLRELDPVETATVLFNVVGWSYVHLRSGHRWKPPRARAATLDIAIHGLAAPERKR